MRKRYKIFIKEISSGYVCHIPAKAMVKVGSNPDEALKAAQLSIEKLAVKDRFFTESVILHLKKLFILTGVFILVIIMTSLLFQQFIDHRILRFEHQVIDTFNAPKEREQERLKRFEKKVKRISPYVNEIKDLMY